MVVRTIPTFRVIEEGEEGNQYDGGRITTAKDSSGQPSPHEELVDGFLVRTKPSGDKRQRRGLTGPAKDR
jgi:hypothetical protein